MPAKIDRQHLGYLKVFLAINQCDSVSLQAVSRMVSFLPQSDLPFLLSTGGSSQHGSFAPAYTLSVEFVSVGSSLLSLSQYFNATQSRLRGTRHWIRKARTVSMFYAFIPATQQPISPSTWRSCSYHYQRSWDSTCQRGESGQSLVLFCLDWRRSFHRHTTHPSKHPPSQSG